MVARLDTAIAAVMVEFDKAYGQHVEYKIGTRGWNENTDAPLVCWIEQGGTLGAPMPAGETEVGEDCDEEELVPHVLTRRADVIIRLWADGNTVEEARHRSELMLEAMIVALHKTPAESFNYTTDGKGIAYTTPTEVKGKWAERGALIDLSNIHVLFALGGETKHTLKTVQLTKQQFDIGTTPDRDTELDDPPGTPAGDVTHVEHEVTP